MIHVRDPIVTIVKLLIARCCARFDGVLVRLSAREVGAADNNMDVTRCGARRDDRVRPLDSEPSAVDREDP